MERMTRLRARILLGLFAFIMVLYAMRLFNLQIISTDGNTDNTTYYTTVTTVRAAGAIFWTGTARFWLATALLTTWFSTISLSNPQITAMNTCIPC